MSEELKGFKIYEIQEKTCIPINIYETNNVDNFVNVFSKVIKEDLGNKTYAIRIGKEGLK